MLAILLPAAGKSSRMRGADKLVEEVHGSPCLRVMATRARKVTNHVFVTLRTNDTARKAALDGLDVTKITTTDADLGMFASLRSGAQNLPETLTAFMILPADMPGITAHDMDTLWVAFQTLRPAILRAGTKDGLAGHPIIFDARFLSQFRNLTAPGETKALLQKHNKDINILPLNDDRAVRDLDTPEDWLTWRAENPLGFG